MKLILLAFLLSSIQAYIPPSTSSCVHRRLAALRSTSDRRFEQPSADNKSNRNSPRLRRRVLARRADAEKQEEARGREDIYFLVVAVVPSILAFILWENLSFSLAEFVDVHGAVGRAVDGNRFSNDLLRPTITGIVVPVISIALATLVSTTVNVLRQRQVDLRALVNKESCDLYLLRRAIHGMFGTRQHSPRRARALGLLSSYADQLSTECRSGAVAKLEELQLDEGIASNELDRLSAMFHGVDGAAASRQGSVAVADDILVRLNGHRSDRVALLLTDFPELHWLVLTALSVFICFTFLLESNQTVNQYLNSIQLRSLFALLVGVFSATATLCLDLRNPFNGSFSLNAVSAQIGVLKVRVQEDIIEARAEASELPSSSRVFFSALIDGPVPETPRTKRYGLTSTLYFHLLTGPLGSNIRALGDAVAWISSFIAKKVRGLRKWKKRSRQEKNE